MCTMYWPDGEGSEGVKQFGDFAITLKKKDVQQDYIEATLQLRNMDVSFPSRGRSRISRKGVCMYKGMGGSLC